MKKNKLKTICYITFLLLVSGSLLQAQSNVDQPKTDTLKTQPPSSERRDTRPFSQRIAFDLTAGFWITPSYTFFEFSPVVAYKFPKVISIGAGPAYIYNRDRKNNTLLNGWGGKVFSKAQLTKWFYLYTEYQGINNQYISEIDLNTKKITKSTKYADSWFLSAGINIRIGRHHGINLQALYDVLYNNGNSPYNNAWIYRLGFGF